MMDSDEFSPKIKLEVDQLNRAFLSFSDSMVIPGNLTDYETPFTMIVELKNSDRSEQEIQKLYYDYNITSFSKKVLELNLNFSEPLEISSD